jgi:hypothetical protein|tara:strand:- start:208 stop:543 length:336 start_codon:yes stop_codon:yes gene_type:complete
MSDYSVTGIVEKVLPVEQVKEWEKGGIVIKTEDEYNNLYPLVAFGKTMEKIANIKEGQQVTAYFNVKANEYQGKYYTNLDVWKVDVLNNASSAPKKEAAFQADGIPDDLPF